ncbi:hypothetical protein ERO13_A08G033400v2 [Gossypium hirsutum]|uniref:Uncharacterized protein n=3 Tax=Gossypium TaxID=3633 RepID=A0A2P5XC17_GOSBA|nr:uncharacterized protein LOC107930514 [Gossypium hirsutum]KAB2068546.1 hypothetical protein ES319_A08G038500v1 [Gossypium barbadense]KAG4186281.1 hypothetical protein ERO13_A08G033400v2 [Gossypium hirsutum]PPS00884.1 hypothetical protein GOBAR_AA19785 [Gossypium barbadense]TYH04885.1 hypothetical protein ES288_A08G041200v1 [Gossypium darwinii]
MAFLMPSPEISTASAKIFSNPTPRHKFLKSCAISKNDDEKVWSRTNARVGVKDAGSTVSGLSQNLRLYVQFSAPVKRGSKPSKEEEEKQDYYVNMGYAIRTLREELPDIFYRELSFDIYRDDIVLKDPLNTFIGIDNYKSFFSALRFHGRIFFKALWLDIVSVWQPMENVIMVRWTIHGIPRVPWESRGRFDGTSEYKLDKKGKIYEHRVDNTALNSPPKFHVLAVEDLIRSIGCPSTPRPTYFEISSASPPEKT